MLKAFMKHSPKRQQQAADDKVRNQALHFAGAVKPAHRVKREPAVKMPDPTFMVILRPDENSGQTSALCRADIQLNIEDSTIIWPDHNTNALR